MRKHSRYTQNVLCFFYSGLNYHWALEEKLFSLINHIIIWMKVIIIISKLHCALIIFHLKVFRKKKKNYYFFFF